MRKDRLKKLARLSTPFAVLALLALVEADEESLTAGFLATAFLCYLVVPSLALGRERVVRD
ncbi:MAG: hypothetical protein R3298_01540 [Gammaproteobacteria bacterium]|nr:hypothetical protein [Gammaproteobacteria bacterium]